MDGITEETIREEEEREIKENSENISSEQQIESENITEESKELEIELINSPQNSKNKKLTKESSDDIYDSDLENKEETHHYDHSGRSDYVKLCQREGVIPAGYFLRHMHDKRLDMRHHGLRQSGIRPICYSLMTNSSITSLDLTDNWLGDESIPYLMAMMKENCFIAELILTNNNITSKSADIISTSLSENMQLKRLDLSQNNLDDKSASVLCDLITYANKLEYLNLSRNDFGSGCLSYFGKAMSQTNSIIEFDLSWNHLSGKETKQFCAGIIDNLSIEKLHLGWNGFGAGVSMNDFGKMLKMNSILEELDLSNNRITAEGAVLLGKGLTANSKLKVLKMGKNPMQTAGCYAILNAILKNTGSLINYLDFEDIRVNQDFLDLKSTASADLTILTGSRKPIRPSSSIHPVKRLKTFVRKKNLPLLKYFEHFDDAENCQLTINDFRLSLQYFCRDTEFDLTENEINLLITYLDKKQNGYISYKDFSVLNPFDKSSLLSQENETNETNNNDQEADQTNKSSNTKVDQENQFDQVEI